MRVVGDADPYERENSGFGVGTGLLDGPDDYPSVCFADSSPDKGSR